MQLHELKPVIKSKIKRRIGRGGKRGTYSGRGMKGQKSRSGRRIKPAIKETIQRLPKLRGFKNKPLKQKPAIISIDKIEKKIEGNVVNREILLKAGMIKKSDKRVKIVGSKGEGTKRAFQIEGLEVSGKLKKAIEAIGHGKA
ncbi:MAG: uL15 family ribosomal protein [Patescibacteria group bacterium]